LFSRTKKFVAAGKLFLFEFTDDRLDDGGSKRLLNVGRLYQITRHNIPEGSHLGTRRRENPESPIFLVCIYVFCCLYLLKLLFKKFLTIFISTNHNSRTTCHSNASENNSSLEALSRSAGQEISPHRIKSLCSLSLSQETDSTRCLKQTESSHYVIIGTCPQLLVKHFKNPNKQHLFPSECNEQRMRNLKSHFTVLSLNETFCIHGFSSTR
jgi:hypothetical protein